jgi:uncharacterized repeat protein (TIGR03943 family)
MATSTQPPNQNLFLPLLDIIALTSWGVLLLKYWLSNQLNLLIHPNYFVLVIITGFALLTIATLRGFQLYTQFRQQARGRAVPLPVGQHISLFPPGWGSALLTITAILGLIITPQVFASQTAIQRGITESISLTRAQPQSFKSPTNPADRTLIEWVRTLNVYPEPDAYTNQAVKVTGFAVHPSDFPPQYFMITRFVITCCAADAYPVGLPVKLKENRTSYPVDSWFEVEGKMITEIFNGRRQLTIEASSLKKVPKPENPYYY